jgi:hypothetical protein
LWPDSPPQTLSLQMQFLYGPSLPVIYDTAPRTFRKVAHQGSGSSCVSTLQPRNVLHLELTQVLHNSSATGYARVPIYGGIYSICTSHNDWRYIQDLIMATDTTISEYDLLQPCLPRTHPQKWHQDGPAAEHLTSLATPQPSPQTAQVLRLTTP